MPKTKILLVALVAVGTIASLGATVGDQTDGSLNANATTNSELFPNTEKPGACIIPGNGNCIQATRTFCIVINGIFQGPGTDCPPEPKDAELATSTDPQPIGGKVGACIVPGNGHCAQVTELVCLLINGDYLGPGSECPPEPKDD